MSADLLERTQTRDRAAPVRRRGVNPWRVSGALAAAVALAAASLHVLFEEQSWWIITALVVTLVLAAAGVTRQFSRVRVAPTAIATTVLIGTLTLFFAPGAAILALIPTPQTLSDFGALFDAASTSIYRQSIPAQADGSIVFVLCLGVGFIAIAADLLAITWRRPALVGILLAGILAVPVATARGVSDPVWFAVTAAAFLLLLVVSGPRRSPVLAVSIGATAIVGALIAPLLLPGIATSVAAVPGFSTGVNPVLGLGDDLRRAADREVLQYSTLSGNAHYLRLVSLDNFTGTQWAPTETDIDRDNTVDDFGPAPGLAREVPTAGETTTVDVGNLSSRWLPLPYPPTRVSGVTDDWYWEPDGFSVSSPTDTSRGQSYVVDSLLVQPTPDQLLAAGTTLTPGFERYLDLPADLPPVISDTANEIAGAASSNYEKALALQEFFRSAAFTYSEDAPVDGGYDGTGMDIIATFLDVRSGYCVHFASSMAVMSRSLGIPARVAVGFLPGSAVVTGGDASYAVTTHDLHAWPELYFDGVGWVQFEPTPGRGELGAYADVTVAGVPAPTATAPPAPAVTPTPSPSAAPGAAPDRAQDGSGSPTITASTGPLPRILGAIALLLGLSVVPALVRRWQRMRLSAALRSGSATAIDVWTEVLRTATDLRIPVRTTATPRDTAAEIGEGPALDRVLAATELEGYAAAAALDLPTLARDLEAVRTMLTARAAPRERVLARLYPASLWSVIAHPLGGADSAPRVVHR